MMDRVRLLEATLAAITATIMAALVMAIWGLVFARGASVDMTAAVVIGLTLGLVQFALSGRRRAVLG